MNVAGDNEPAKEAAHLLVAEARSHLKQGSGSEAADAFRAALRLRPGTLAAVTGLTRLLESAPLQGEENASAAPQREAERIWRDLVSADPTPSHLAAAARQWEAWETAASKAGGRALRLALVGTGTLGPLGAHLRVACAQAGLHPVVRVGEFNQWMQELLDPQGFLHDLQPEVIALCIDAATLFPRTMTDTGAPAEALNAERNAGIAQIGAAVKAAASRFPAAVFILHTFAVPDFSPLGVRDLLEDESESEGGGQRRRVERLNAALIEWVRAEYGSSRRQQRCLLLDQERAEARFGKRLVRDDRMWYLGALPFSEAFSPHLAHEYLRLLRPLKGLTRKCIVLDLDNTLWGGVAGEDGMAGLKLGGTAAPGNAFHDFQVYLDELREQGVLLALCSKNNESDVLPILQDHPDMILRPDRFAARRINWDSKAVNIAAIARELNIGLDSLVFVDDNPAERALVRQELPDVLTVDLPADPALYLRTLRDLSVFEALTITDEDRRRSEQYREQQERRAFEQEHSSHADPSDASPSEPGERGDALSAYLAGLGMRVSLAEATDFTLPRIAQLINKTNQFNLTTRRYTEAEARTLVADTAQWGVYAASVSDRFGDSGLTGVAIVQKRADVWEINSFLLSCRVMGRGVETALLTYIIRNARGAGARVLRGAFVPSAKNAPARSFYEAQGFARTQSDSGTRESATELDGPQWYELALDTERANAPYPYWMAVQDKIGESRAGGPITSSENT